MISARGLFKTVEWRVFTPRMLAGAVGLVFLTASLFKAADVALFIRQIKAYGIISEGAVVTLTAWGLIGLECVLGVGLLLFYRPRLFLSLTSTLLLVFLAATSWAWLTGSTEDCGCFGAWMQRSPGEESVENIVLLVATFLACAGCRHSEAAQSRAKTWAVFAACLIGLALPATSVSPISMLNRSDSKAIEAGIGQVEIQGLGQVDLDCGAHLIVLMGTDCLHCQEAIPELNYLAEMPDLPPVVALCTSDDPDCMRFIDEFQPDFPVARISEELFWRLLADGDVPRVILLQDGRVEQAWDQAVPNEDIIRAKASVDGLTASEGEKVRG